MKKLSRTAQYTILGTIAAGVAAALWFLQSLTIQHPIALIIACLLATLLQIFKIEGAAERSSYNLSWVVYGATFAGLGAQEMLLVILVAHTVEWLWHHYPWYVQSFNMAAFAITTVVASLIFDGWMALSFDILGVRRAIAVLLAMLGFTLVNHLLVGLAIKWARGQSLGESGVFTWSTLTIDFGLLCLGASAAIVMQTNPASIVLILIVAYLVQSALRVPALERKTVLDPKTGLYNAQHFDSAVQREIARAHRRNRALTVVMADLDRMRDLNNTYGHLAGDTVLKKIAGILQAHTRDGDVVARFGGEEFGILLSDTSPEEAVPLVESIRHTIESTEVMIPSSDSPIRATMSFGIAGRTDSRQSAKELVHSADIAVYQAKHAGRNCVVVYCPDSATSGIEPGIETSAGSIAEPESPAHLPPLSKFGQAFNTMPAMARTGKHPIQIQPAIPTNDSVSDTTAPVAKEPASNERWIQLYGAATMLVAVGLTALSAMLSPIGPIDWPAIMLFMLAAAGLELFATQIYSRDTSVSTSVATTVASTMVFGTLGALVSCFVIASINQIRSRKPINRLLFNVSNHLIGSTLSLVLIRLAPGPVVDWSLYLQFAFAVLASVVIYLSSTTILAFVLSLSTGQRVFRIWQERFKWLCLHYVALGVVGFVLVYSYGAIGALGVLVMLVPLAMLHVSQHQYVKATESMVKQLNEKNEILSNRNREVQRLNDELLLALASTIDLRDPFVVEHSRHVARYAALVAEELKLSTARIHLVYQAGLIHDIGKLAIPEAILFKPGRLTDDEYEVIKEHVTVGADLLDDFQSLHAVGNFVRHHHERYDGRGYPDQLAGEEIPLEARILALADAVEAMASDRPYRPGSSVAAIIKEVTSQAGTQFDPHVVEAFVNVIKKLGDSTIVNSARSVELLELMSNAALREGFASWNTPKPFTLPSALPNLATLAPESKM